MNKRVRSVVAMVVVFGLGLGITTAVAISATIEAVTHMGLA